jgi:aryl-alcohol dehydrogenase-like predicted oxidoreductase
MPLTDYRTLGRSGLIVSPLALGTMTFGNTNFGSRDDGSRAVFDAYLDAGGNFLDTANVYGGGGRSEALLGEFIAERGVRDQIVLATKFGQNIDKTQVYGGGNGRKQIHHELSRSLDRLQTDFVDLYWMHVYDQLTPVEEVVQALADLVRAGRIRYYGFSNCPAWYAAKAATLAAAGNIASPVGLQMEYSLVERNIEHEHVPAVRECGLNIVSWSPLAGGFLSGKYSRESEAAPRGRLDGVSNFPGKFTKFTEHNWQVLDTLLPVAQELGCSPAQAALAWNVARPGVASALVGVSTVMQLQENLAALEIVFSDDQLARLDAASALPQTYPYVVMDWEPGRGPYQGRPIRRWDR